jgi:hypothetical protein
MYIRRVTFIPSFLMFPPEAVNIKIMRCCGFQFITEVNSWINAFYSQLLQFSTFGFTITVS